MLKKQVSPKIVAIVFAVIVVCFAIAVYVSAWTEPSAVPPGANVATPLNVSNAGQTKIGGLALNTGVDGIPSADGAGSGLLIYDGNVGIGTATPLSKLQVQNVGDSTLTINSLTYTGGANGFQIIQRTNGTVDIINSQRQIFSIDTSGKIVAPSSGIEISGNLAINGAINSKSTFSYRRDSVPLNWYLAISFPDLAMGTCTITVPTVGVSRIAHYMFSVGGGNAVVSELHDLGGNYFTGVTSGTKVKLKNNEFTCTGNYECTYIVSCFGYNLYPAAVSVEP